MISIFNELGQQVIPQKQYTISGQGTFKVEGNKLSQGVYFVQAIYGDQKPGSRWCFNFFVTPEGLFA